MKNHTCSLICTFDTLCWSSPRACARPAACAGRGALGAGEPEPHSSLLGGPSLCSSRRAPTRHLCPGGEALCPHLRSPRCHTAGLEAIRRQVCTGVQGAEATSGSPLLWESLRSQENLQQNSGSPHTLFMAIPLPIEYTSCFSVDNGGGRGVDSVL